jgi:hypothetical protein
MFPGQLLDIQNPKLCNFDNFDKSIQRFATFKKSSKIEFEDDWKDAANPGEVDSMIGMMSRFLVDLHPPNEHSSIFNSFRKL